MQQPVSLVVKGQERKLYIEKINLWPKEMFKEVESKIS